MDWFSSNFPGLETALAIGGGLLALAHLLAYYLRLMGFPFRPSARPTRAGVMLEIIPMGRKYSVVDASRLATDLVVTGWGGQGEWVADGQRYRTRREGVIKDRYLLESGGVVLARAEPGRIFGVDMAVEYGGRRITLRTKYFFPLFSSDLEVREGDRVVGSFVRKGLFSGPATAELPADLPKPIHLFIVWSATIVWEGRSRG